MKKYLFIFLSCLFFSGCESVIDLEPENAETQTNYFKSEKDIANLIRAMHQRIKMAENIEEREVFGWIGGEVKNIKVTSRYEEILRLDFNYYITRAISWSTLYSVNYNADFLLNNLYRVENVTPDRMEFYCQQAYFGKAYTYFRLAQAWGEAVIINDYLDLNPKGKSTVNEVLNEATHWAIKALDLPKSGEIKDETGSTVTNKQWASKGAAAALLAHIYAWRAAMEDNQEYWKEAEKYCTMIIENEAGHYQLASDPKEVCEKVLQRNSPESIWEISHVPDIDNPRGISNPYAVFSEMSLPFNVSDDRHNTTINLNRQELEALYDPSDTLRLHNYFYGWGIEADKADSLAYDLTGNKWVSTFGDQRFIYKWRHHTLKNPDRAGDPMVYSTMDVNRVVWRLADIILLRAEARERGGLAGAEGDLNRIRQRAGIGDYKPSEGTLEYAIFKERKRELIYEGMYFFDVIRNGFAYLNQKSGYDYIRKELTPAFSALTDQQIKDGALYLPVHSEAFVANSPMLQNVYWLSRY